VAGDFFFFFLNLKKRVAMQKLQICQTDSSPQENQQTVKKKKGWALCAFFFPLRDICNIKPDRSPW